MTFQCVATIPNSKTLIFERNTISFVCMCFFFKFISTINYVIKKLTIINHRIINLFQTQRIKKKWSRSHTFYVLTFIIFFCFFYFYTNLNNNEIFRILCDFAFVVVVVVIPHFSLARLLNVVREFQLINIKQTLENQQMRSLVFESHFSIA